MGAVEVTFLGSGDAFCAGARCQACIQVAGDGEPLLLDFGATSLFALRRAEIDPASVGWIAISHLHGDHFGGLPFLVIDGDAVGRSHPLGIAGPPGTPGRLDQAIEALYRGSAETEHSFPLDLTTLAPEVPTPFGPAVITPFEARHGSSGPALSLRVEYGGKVVAYSGDTEWNDGLVRAARGADLFVCECNFFAGGEGGHLDYQTLSRERGALECERLVLTHMGEEMLARLDEVQFETAADGLTLTL